VPHRPTSANVPADVGGTKCDDKCAFDKIARPIVGWLAGVAVYLVSKKPREHRLPPQATQPERDVHDSVAPYCTTAWAIWPGSDDDMSDLQRRVDAILTGYSWYPEAEWGLYGYRPPEEYPLLGAWRSPTTTAFVFLLQEPHGVCHINGQCLLFFAGGVSEKELVAEKVNRLKSDLARLDRQEVRDWKIEGRINSAQKSGLLTRLLMLLGPLTAVINAFALYLRKLPPPPIDNTFFREVFSYLFYFIHVGALSLLLVFIVICIGYVGKCGLLIVRKL
jgi:hypothetical protein